MMVGIMHGSNRTKAFTLIELLIVISVIGLMATIGVVALRETREKSRRVKADSDLQQILKAVTVAQVQNNKALKDITGSGCSNCACGGACGYTCEACRARMETTMRSIGLPGAMKDPWGKYYAIDENELEYPADPCRRDSIVSSGYPKVISVPYSGACQY
jgi:prepilin-type N-terminal cleavage/methylation domain-containing protein